MATTPRLPGGPGPGGDAPPTTASTAVSPPTPPPLAASHHHDEHDREHESVSLLVAPSRRGGDAQGAFSAGGGEDEIDDGALCDEAHAAVTAGDVMLPVPISAAARALSTASAGGGGGGGGGAGCLSLVGAPPRRATVGTPVACALPPGAALAPPELELTAAGRGAGGGRERRASSSVTGGAASTAPPAASSGGGAATTPSAGATATAGATAPSDGETVTQSASFRQRSAGAPSLGLLLMLLSTFAFSAMSLMLNLAGRAGMPATQLSSVRFFIQCTLCAATIVWGRRDRLRRPETWLGKRANRRLLVLRACLGGVGMTAYFFSATYPGARLGDISALSFVSVPATALVAYYALKEPFTKLDAATAVACMAGVLLIVQPPVLFASADAQPTPLPVLLCMMLHVVAATAVFITLRQIGSAEDTLVVVLYFSVLGCVLAPLSSFVFSEVWVLPAGPREWGLLLGMGFAGYLGQVFMNRGVQLAPAGPASVMRYADVVFAITFQVSIFGQVPNALKLVGSAMIMSGMAAVYWKHRAKERAKRAAAAAAATAAAGGSTPAPAAAAAQPPAQSRAAV